MESLEEAQVLTVTAAYQYPNDANLQSYVRAAFEATEISCLHCQSSFALVSNLQLLSLARNNRLHLDTCDALSCDHASSPEIEV